MPSPRKQPKPLPVVVVPAPTPPPAPKPEPEPDVLSMLDGLAADPNAAFKVRVYFKDPATKRDLFRVTIPAGEFSPEWLQDTQGGGVFKLQVVDERHRVVKSFEFPVDGPPKSLAPEPAPVAAAPALAPVVVQQPAQQPMNVTEVVLAMMKQSNDQFLKMLELQMMRPREGGGSSKLVELLLTHALEKSKSTGGSTFGEMLDAFSKLQRLTGGDNGGGGGGDAAEFAKLFGMVKDILPAAAAAPAPASPVPAGFVPVRVESFPRMAAGAAPVAAESSRPGGASPVASADAKQSGGPEARVDDDGMPLAGNPAASAASAAPGAAVSVDMLEGAIQGEIAPLVRLALNGSEAPESYAGVIADGIVDGGEIAEGWAKGRTREQWERTLAGAHEPSDDEGKETLAIIAERLAELFSGAAAEAA